MLEKSILFKINKYILVQVQHMGRGKHSVPSKHSACSVFQVTKLSFLQGRSIRIIKNICESSS